MATPKFERQTFFQAGPADNSAAQLAQGLASAFKTFGNVSLEIGKEDARLDAETKKRITAIDDAASASLSVDLEVATDEAKKLFPDDLDAFKDHINTVAKAKTKHAPPHIKAAAIEANKKFFGKALNDVVVGENKRIVNELKVETGNTVKSAGVQGANAARELNPDGVQKNRNVLSLSMNNELYTDKERVVALEKYDVQVRQEQMIGNAFKVADEEGYLKAYSTLQSIEQKGIKGIHPDEITVAVKQARSQLDTKRKVEENQEEASDTATEKIQGVNAEALLVSATEVHNQPDKQAQVLQNATEKLKEGEITHVQFRKVRDEINAPTGHDNILVEEGIWSDIYGDTSPADIEADIAEGRRTGQLTPQKAIALRKENQFKKNRLSSESGGQSPFDLSVKNAYTVMKVKMTGSSLVEGITGVKKQRIGDALAEFNERMLTAEEEGLRPIDIANDIASRYSTETATLKSFPTLRLEGDRSSLEGLQKAAKRLQLEQTKFFAGDSKLTMNDLMREAQLILDLKEFHQNKTLEESDKGVK